MLALPAAPMAPKAFMIPQTVPNRPINGATVAVVARKPRPPLAIRPAWPRRSRLPGAPVEVRERVRTNSVVSTGMYLGGAERSGEAGPGTRGRARFATAAPKSFGKRQ